MSYSNNTALYPTSYFYLIIEIDAMQTFRIFDFPYCSRRDRSLSHRHFSIRRFYLFHDVQHSRHWSNYRIMRNRTKDICLIGEKSNLYVDILPVENSENLLFAVALGDMENNTQLLEFEYQSATNTLQQTKRILL